MQTQTTFILIAFLFGISLSESRAQQDVIGQLQRIADISSEKPVQIKEETDRVRIQRTEWINARPKIELFQNELVQVKKNIRADLRIRRPDQKGNIYLVPDAPDTLHAIQEEGIYRISETPETVGGLRLLLVKGALAVDWVYGFLSVDAVGISIDISGTKVAIVVDEGGDDGLLFLEEGSVRFPEFPDLQVNAMEAVRLQRGLPPVKFNLGAEQVQQYQDYVRYNVREVWSQVRPWWQKPKFYIPAVAVTVGAGVLLIDGGGGDNGSAIGSVAIGIPK